MALPSYLSYATTGFSDTFVLQTGGYVAGTVVDDPGLRYQLEGGVVVSSATSPLYGGMPVTLAIPALGAQAGAPMGPIATVATAGNIDAWVVFNQAAHMPISTQSNVPLAGPNMGIHFIRPGCNLRLALPVNPSIIDSLAGERPNQQVSWDFTNQYITTYSADALPILIEFIDTNSKIVSVSGSNYTWTTGACAIVRI